MNLRHSRQAASVVVPALLKGRTSRGSSWGIAALAPLLPLRILSFPALSGIFKSRGERVAMRNAMFPLREK